MLGLLVFQTLLVAAFGAVGGVPAALAAATVLTAVNLSWTVSAWRDR